MIPQPNPQPWPGPCTTPANRKTISSITMSLSASVAPSSGNGNVTGTGSASANWTRDDTFPCWELPNPPSPPPSPATGKFYDCAACCDLIDIIGGNTSASEIGSWTCTPPSGPSQNGTWILLVSITDGTMPGTYKLSGAAEIANNITCCFGNSSVGNFLADNIAADDLIGSHEFTYNNSVYGSTLTFTIDIS